MCNIRSALARDEEIINKTRTQEAPTDTDTHTHTCRIPHLLKNMKKSQKNCTRIRYDRRESKCCHPRKENKHKKKKKKEHTHTKHTEEEKKSSIYIYPLKTIFL